MRRILLLISLLLFTLSLPAEDKDNKNGNEKIDPNAIDMVYLKNGCSNCHGFYGQGTSTGPRLQNKKEKYLLRRLRNLQKGITKTPEGEIMVQFAKSLDANQTKEMAHYLSIIQTSYENQIEYDYDGDDFGDS